MWKSSALPLLFYGGIADGVLTPNDKLNIDQLEGKAKHMYARFRTDETVGFECVDGTMNLNGGQLERADLDSLIDVEERRSTNPSASTSSTY
jgi:hypothetical protein